MSDLTPPFEAWETTWYMREWSGGCFCIDIPNSSFLDSTMIRELQDKKIKFFVSQTKSRVDTPIGPSHLNFLSVILCDELYPDLEEYPW